MNAKISAALWTASVSAAAVTIFILHQFLWIPPLAEANTEGNILLAKVINAVSHRQAGPAPDSQGSHPTVTVVTRQSGSAPDSQGPHPTVRVGTRLLR